MSRRFCYFSLLPRVCLSSSYSSDIPEPRRFQKQSLPSVGDLSIPFSTRWTAFMRMSLITPHTGYPLLSTLSSVSVLNIKSSDWTLAGCEWIIGPGICFRITTAGCARGSTRCGCGFFQMSAKASPCRRVTFRDYNQKLRFSWGDSPLFNCSSRT